MEIVKAFAFGVNPATGVEIVVGTGFTIHGRDYTLNHDFASDLGAASQITVTHRRSYESYETERLARGAADPRFLYAARSHGPYFAVGGGHPVPEDRHGGYWKGRVDATAKAQPYGVISTRPVQLSMVINETRAIISAPLPLTTEAEQLGWTNARIAAARVTTNDAHNDAVRVGNLRWNVSGAVLSPNFAFDLAGLQAPAAASVQPNGTILVAAPEGVTLNPASRLYWIGDGDHPATFPGVDMGWGALLMPSKVEVMAVVPAWDGAVAGDPAVFFSTSGGTYFRDSGMPAGVTRIEHEIRLKLNGAPTTPGHVFAQHFTGFDLRLGTDGQMRLTLEDGAGTKMWDSLIVGASPAVGTWATIRAEADMPAGTARITIDGAQLWAGNFTPGQASFQSGRAVSWLALFDGVTPVPAGTSVEYAERAGSRLRACGPCASAPRAARRR